MELLSAFKNYVAAAAVLLFIPGLFILLLIGIYRIWFHPLAKYPGPFWAKLTDFYAGYHSWKGDLHLDMWKCHQLYGDHIRYSPNRLIFNTPTALNDTYVVGHNIIKSKGYLSMMHRVANTITQRDKALHAKQRRLLSNGFSEAALRAYEQPLAEHVENFCHFLLKGPNPQEPDQEALNGGWSEPRDMAHWCDYVTFDIILDIVYGFKSRMLSSPDNRPLLTALSTSNKRVGVMIPLHFLKNTLLDRYLFPKAIMARYVFIGFIRKLLAEQKERTGEITAEEKERERMNIFRIMLSANDGEGLTYNEIASESTNLITAGFETMSTVLSATLFYLAHNPHAYNRLVDELQTTFKTADQLHDRTLLNSCIYLRACLTESMRLSPPVPSSPFREVTASSPPLNSSPHSKHKSNSPSFGAIIDGHYLAPGTDIGTSIYAIHHTDKYFPYPHTFIPSRWLAHDADSPLLSTPENIKLANEAYNPFSVGPRQCIGKNLAMREMMSVLASLLWRFEVKLAEGEKGRIGEGWKGGKWGREREGEYQMEDHVVASRKGPFLQFRVRER